MLTPKRLPLHDEGSGADLLAGVMVAYQAPMNLHNLPLAQLHNAPDAWNFYKPLPDHKFYELISSIEQNGLLVPLIVWEQADGYMILSGHNRCRALEMLHARTGDAQYKAASCAVYAQQALTDDAARAILIDCNWVQRQLSTTEKAKSIYTKYVELGRQPRGSGKRRYDVVAEHFGLKATQVYQYYKLAQLEPHWLNKLDAGEISIKAAVHLCSLTQAQRAQALAKEDLSQDDIMQVEACFTQDETHRALFRERATQLREFRIQVPEERYDALKEMVERWLEGDEG